MLEIKGLMAEVDGKPILKGIDLVNDFFSIVEV